MPTIKVSAALLTAALLICLTGCNQKPGHKVLAQVNGQVLTAADVSFRLEDAHGKTPQYGKKSINDIINQELLFQQGVRLGLDQDPGYRRQLAKLNQMPRGAKRLEMARRVFSTQIAPMAEVGYQDGKEYYQKNAERIGTELHLNLVRFEQKAQAEEALKKLRAGVDFASVAKPVLPGTTGKGKQPWDLGFVKWEQVPVDFADAIYRLNPGEVSEVLGSQATGFQVVKLLEKRKISRPSYEKISAGVINRLRDLKLITAYNQYLETLRKEAKIVTF
jgi:peptidyl-prolyl cis-trans isomerase C